MAYSKIIITFVDNAQIGNFIRFDITNHNNGNVTQSTETCFYSRQEPEMFAYNSDVGITISNYFTALNYDINSTNLYTITKYGSTVTIEAKSENVTFSGFFSTVSNIYAVVQNEPLVTAFDITSVSFSQASANECSNVSVDILATDEITSVTSPVAISGDGNNDISFDYVRGSTINVIVTNGVTTKSKIVTLPAFLNNPIVNTVLTPSGANVTITGNTMSGLTYSLDGVTYKSSSIFYGIVEGDYTAYVKDAYGCIKTTDFSITIFTPSIAPKTEYAFISNTNSIRYKKDQEWDNINYFKNDDNTLSSEEDVILAYPYIQKFQSNNIVTTQIKTNYSNIDVYVTDQNGNVDSPTIYKKTTNIGKKDRRDALGYELSDGRYGIYFQTGNTYDYDTQIANGTYQLFGKVPSWAKIGQYFNIDDLAYYEIKDIVFVEEINSEVLIISSLAGSPNNKVVSTTYNSFNWDAYEFDIDMSAYENDCIQVRVDLTDSVFNDVTFLSEKISVYNKLDDHLTVKYSNSNNNEILYSTGINHLLYLDYTLFGLASETSIEIHKTDNYVYSLNSDVYKKKKVEFVNLSTMMAQKVIQAFSLDTININGINYTTESINEPSRIGVTNLYKLEITVYRTSEGAEQQDVDVISGIDEIEVPALAKGNDGFIEL